MLAKSGICAAPLLAALVSCASTYAPGRDAPTADLILSSNLADDPFREGESGERATNHNAFTAFGDALCQQPLGTLGAFANHDGARKTVRVEAGKRIYVRVGWTNRARIDASQVAQRSCHNLVSFEPEAGETYDLEQEILSEQYVFGARARCRAVVRTFAAYGPTKSFQDHPLRGQCAEATQGG